MRSTALWAGLALALTTAGCAKRSAESAIGQAERSIAAVRADAEKIAPNELKGLTDSLEAMKAKVASGDYSGALMGARSLASLARDLGANLPARREQLTNSYNAVAAEVPKLLDQATARVNELAAMRRLPPGIDPARFAAVRTESTGWAGAWTEAAAAFSQGNLAQALNLAGGLRDKLTAALKTLGIG